MAKRKSKTVSHKPDVFAGRELEYIMTKGMFDDITKECKGDKMQDALDYVNNTFGLLGWVTTLTIEGV